MNAMIARLSLVFIALLVGCAKPRRIYVSPKDDRDLKGVSFLSYSSSRVQGFLDAKGRRCPPFGGRVRDAFAGWWTDDDDPICSHETLEGGTQPAKLELRWSGTVPADGSYDVLSAGYALATFGQVIVRGSYFGDFWSRAQVVIDAESPHCRGNWSTELALAKMTGPYKRSAAFSGWVEIPDIRVVGCKEGDRLDVRVQLIAQSNRGAIDVETFGFWAQTNDELDRIFGIKPAPAGPDRAAAR